MYFSVSLTFYQFGENNDRTLFITPYLYHIFPNYVIYVTAHRLLILDNFDSHLNINALVILLILCHDLARRCRVN